MHHTNPQKTTQQLVDFLKRTFQQSGFSDALIAVSGGIDSAVSCALVVRALGPGHVFPLLLPYGNLNQKGTEDARLVVQRLYIPDMNIKLVDIKPLLSPLFVMIPESDNFRRGNAMARMRMIIVYDSAKRLPGLVVGTENRTENLLGYFTRFGDEASDVEPLRSLFKTQVYEIAKYLEVPEQILTKSPTAGLWEGQADEEEFGFTYKEADEILHLMFDEKKSIHEIIANGYEERIVLAVHKRVKENEFKHKVPYQL